MSPKKNAMTAFPFSAIAGVRMSRIRTEAQSGLVFRCHIGRMTPLILFVLVASAISSPTFDAFSTVVPAAARLTMRPTTSGGGTSELAPDPPRDDALRGGASESASFVSDLRRLRQTFEGMKMNFYRDELWPVLDTHFLDPFAREEISRTFRLWERCAQDTVDSHREHRAEEIEVLLAIHRKVSEKFHRRLSEEERNIVQKLKLLQQGLSKSGVKPKSDKKKKKRLEAKIELLKETAKEWREAAAVLEKARSARSSVEESSDAVLESA